MEFLTVEVLPNVLTREAPAVSSAMMGISFTGGCLRLHGGDGVAIAVAGLPKGQRRDAGTGSRPGRTDDAVRKMGIPAFSAALPRIRLIEATGALS